MQGNQSRSSDPSVVLGSTGFGHTDMTAAYRLDRYEGFTPGNTTRRRVTLDDHCLGHVCGDESCTFVIKDHPR